MNEHFRAVALEHASRLITHGPTVLVTSADGERRNVMAAAWSMPVEFTPPRIAVVIDKRTCTRELIAASGAFGLCLPGAALVDLTDTRIFASDHWLFSEDNVGLQTIHHLGGGNFVRAGDVLRAHPM